LVRPVRDPLPSNSDNEAIFHGPAAQALLGAAQPAAIAGNAYTFAVLDPGDLISSTIEAQIGVDANYVIGLISHYLAWQGTMDFVVEIRPAAELTFSDANGLLPSITQLTWNGSGWVNDTLVECLTGVDNQPARPDAGCTIYLGDDGTIRNYGSPVWFDPNPRFETNAGVPAGMHDFVGILTHEIFHSLGFNMNTIEWQSHIVTTNGISWFHGANAEALFGGPVPFIQGFDHYGDTDDPGIPISRGLMFEFGNYALNRIDIGRIDLAILADLGHEVKSEDGLPLFELIDTQPNLTGSAANELLYGDYHANTLTGQAGADALYGGSGADRLEGGLGNDWLAGGSGADLFVFSSLADSRLTALRSDGGKRLPDVIADFTSGVDRIDLSALDAVAGTAGDQAFSFIGSAAFSGQAGQLRYEMHGDNAFILADLNGDRHADFQIIAATPVLQAADFIL
jgi:hypothetical protein